MLKQLPKQIALVYELDRKIGEGANGETWLLHRRIEKFPAVLKFLKYLSAEDFKAVELFQREAELLKKVHVKGVPAFYSYCTDDEGNGYLLQEYIPYPSIQALLDNGRVFNEQETLSVALQIAKILEQLQTKYTPPIIHRDIKPSNILYHSQEKRVWLIDFGSVAHPQKRTGGSTIAGTFGYMPPEQMVGDIALQSDFYALGATMLHMITGMFPGEMPSHGYELDLETILRDKAPNISPQMTQLLISLLSVDIDKRPHTARMLCDTIQKTMVAPKRSITNRIMHRLYQWLIPAHDDVSASGTLTKDGELRFYHKRIPLFWHCAEGVVQNLHKPEADDDEYYLIEYTFEARGQTWYGALYTKNQLVMNFIPKDSTEEHPFNNRPLAKCKVLYSQIAPWNKMLYSIISSDIMK